MRTSVLLLACPAAVAAVLACSGSGSTAQASCNTCPCLQDAGAAATTLETPTGCTPGTPVASVFPPPGGASATAAQRLGVHTVGDTVAFDVPDGTASITIVEQAVSAPISLTLHPSCAPPSVIDNVAVPLRLRDPTGVVVYDDSAALPANPENVAAFFDSDSPFTGTLTIPNTSTALRQVAASGKVAAGTWQLTVSDFGYECTFPQSNGASCSGGSRASAYDVTVITKPAAAAGGVATSGAIDVAFYLATTQTSDVNRPIDLSRLDSDPDLQRVKTAVGSLLARAGIQLGNVTFEALPDAVRARYANGLDVDQQGGCADVPQLLANAKAGNTLNIFLVSSLHSGETRNGNEVVGIDGTIPGPASIGGTVASGAAVSSGDLRARAAVAPGSPDPCTTTPLNFACGDDQIAYVIAHEAGHFLGLYHTTEADGTLFDPLADTARCPCQTCAPLSQRSQCAGAPGAPAMPYQVQISDCARASSGCGGGDNLMFWIFSRGSAGNLTSEQAQVMRANPLVH